MSNELQKVEELEAVAIQPANLFGTSDPQMALTKAAAVATVLTRVIKEQGLFKQIGTKAHIFVDAWTFLGSMLGVFPNVVWSKRIMDGETPIGWEARVEAKTLAGQVVGSAEASCLYNERNWKGRDDYAVRSMAQTRATGKAMRLPLGFIVVLAGYSATPAEEMVEGEAVAVPPVGVAPMPPSTVESANGLSTEEYLAEAKARSVSALKTYAHPGVPGLSTAIPLAMDGDPGHTDADAPPETRSHIRKCDCGKEYNTLENTGPRCTECEVERYEKRKAEKAAALAKLEAEDNAAPKDEAGLFNEQLEKERAKKGFNRPASIPEWCTCGLPIVKYESRDAAAAYWECSFRNTERHKMLEAGESKANIKEVLKGHFEVKYAGKAS